MKKLPRTNKIAAASPIVHMTPQEIIKIVVQVVDPLITARNDTLKTLFIAEIKDIKKDMHGMKEEMHGMKEEIKDLKQGQERIEHKLDTTVKDHKQRIERIEVRLGIPQ